MHNSLPSILNFLKRKVGIDAMVQAVRWRSVTAEGPIQSQESPYEMCGRQSGIRVGFYPSISVSPACIIPPILHSRLHLNVALTGRTNGRNLRAFKMLLIGNRGDWVENWSKSIKEIKEVFISPCFVCVRIFKQAVVSCINLVCW